MTMNPITIAEGGPTKHASVNFDPLDPKMTTIPTDAEWSADAHGMRAGLLAAELAFGMSAASLKRLLDPRNENGDRNRENLMETLNHAADGFGEYKTFCLEAGARVLAAREALELDWPADA